MFSNHRFGVGNLKHPGYNDAGTAISVGSSVLGGMMGDDAAGDSAAASNAGLLKAIEELRSADNRTRADTSPYRELGASASNKLASMLGIGTPTGYAAKPTREYIMNKVTNDHFNKYGTPFNENDTAGINNMVDDLYNQALTEWESGKNAYLSSNPQASSEYGSLLKKFSLDDLNKDVVYNTGLQFGLDEGTKALNNRARASGGTDSGSVLKALTRYGNDYATTKAGDAYNRYTGEQTNQYNMLSGATGIGQNAVNTSANSGTAIGSAIAGAQNSIGQNNAAARMGSANAWGNALSGISNAAQNYSLAGILKGL